MLEVIDSDWLMQIIESSKTPNKKEGFFSKEYWRSIWHNEVIQEAKKENIELEIDFSGRVSKWKAIQTGNKLYLKAIGINKVPIINTYMLYSDTASKLYLKIN